MERVDNDPLILFEDLQVSQREPTSGPDRRARPEQPLPEQSAGIPRCWWPTLYILDHREIIRHKFSGATRAENRDAAIDALVQEAEKQAARSKKNQSRIAADFTPQSRRWISGRTTPKPDPNRPGHQKYVPVFDDEMSLIRSLHSASPLVEKTRSA